MQWILKICHFSVFHQCWLTECAKLWVQRSCVIIWGALLKSLGYSIQQTWNQSKVSGSNPQLIVEYFVLRYDVGEVEGHFEVTVFKVINKWRISTIDNQSAFLIYQNVWSLNMLFAFELKTYNLCNMIGWLTFCSDCDVQLYPFSHSPCELPHHGGFNVFSYSQLG